MLWTGSSVRKGLDADLLTKDKVVRLAALIEAGSTAPSSTDHPWTSADATRYVETEQKMGNVCGRLEAAPPGSADG
jgi:hypothetical protein